jgi:hypothetical protein
MEQEKKTIQNLLEKGDLSLFYLSGVVRKIIEQNSDYSDYNSDYYYNGLVGIGDEMGVSESLKITKDRSLKFLPKKRVFLKQRVYDGRFCYTGKTRKNEPFIDHLRQHLYESVELLKENKLDLEKIMWNPTGLNNYQSNTNKH